MNLSQKHFYKNFGTQMNTDDKRDNFAWSKNWTAERSDAGPSASEGERQGWREHKRRWIMRVFVLSAFIFLKSALICGLKVL
jgi:hypothetical protein